MDAPSAWELFRQTGEPVFYSLHRELSGQKPSPPQPQARN
jgi:hypothetical protein